MIEVYQIPENTDFTKQNVLYGKDLGNNFTAYYIQGANFVYIGETFEKMPKMKLIGFFLPEYLTRIPKVGEKTKLENLSPKGKYIKTIQNKPTSTGLELLIDIREESNNIIRPVDTFKIKNNEQFDYDHLSGIVKK